MINKLVKGKTAVFIDSSNIYFAQKEKGWQFDFLKLKQYLKEQVDVWQIFFYTAHDPEHKKQKKFLDFLELTGYIVRTKKVKFIKDKTKTEGGFHKGNLDVELTIDAVHNKNKFDSFLLFSGDSDFVALVKYLKFYKKRCLVFSVKGHIAIELIREVKFVDIKKLRKFVSK